MPITMMIQSHFHRSPLSSRFATSTTLAIVWIAALLCSGCGHETNPAVVRDGYYIAHLQDTNPIWFKAEDVTGSGEDKRIRPFPVVIPALGAGASIADLAVLSFRDSGSGDAFLYLVSSKTNSLIVLKKSGVDFQLVATIPVGADVG